jgi:ssDNA-binding Zn-finger/Zn-ribbon topoisomerase 1
MIERNEHITEPTKIGARLTCPACGNQVVVVKPSNTRFTCCDGSPMTARNSKEHDVSSR